MVLACVVGGVDAFAQTADTATKTIDPPDLAIERANFLRQTLADSQLLTEQYERALAKLENEVAAAADYEEARLIQQRRAELKALYPSNDPSLSQALATPLLVSLARLSGSAEVRGEMLTGWRTSGSTAEWSNIRLTPGRYILELEANMVASPAIQGSLAPGKSQPQNLAGFEFYEVSLLPGMQENKRSFDISINADDTTFTPLRIGPIHFTRSAVTIRLTNTAGYPGNMIRLRNLRLVPVHEDVTTHTTAETAVDTSLEDLRKELSNGLIEAHKPVFDAYLAQLREISANSPNLRDEATVEINRVYKLMTTDHAGNGSLLPLFSSSTGVGGYEDVDGARFVSNDENRGDRFIVEHEGRQLKVRLLWVRCAPTNEKDSTRKNFAKRFNIDEDDVPGIGRVAQEFTAGYLEGKPLRLLIRPGSEKDGTVSALVFLPEVGLYQNVLVDQGLAYVEVPGKNTRSQTMEKALLGGLIEREQQAKRQQTGAWALSMEERK